MPEYAGQILRVDQTSGAVDATYLNIDDDDNQMASADAGTVWNLCGIDMAAPPVLDRRIIAGTLLDGSAFSYEVLHFVARGKDFYVLPADRAPEAVASVTQSQPQGAAAPVNYFDLGQTVDDEPLRAGTALMVRFNAAGDPIGRGIEDVVVADDDALVQLGGAETGVAAEVLFGPDLTAHPFDAGGQMALVRVSYQAGTTQGTFEALRYIVDGPGAGSQHYLIPRTGSVDLSTITKFLGEVVQPGGLNGFNYADFGLNQDRLTIAGTAAADFIEGGVTHDRILGLGGADALVGGLGADSLDGDLGNDTLQGGSQNDTLQGGDGLDFLQGGNDRDRIFGGNGADQLIGNWGNDTLYGGAGNDRMNAGSDNDLVYGGAGNDLLNGYNEDDTLDGGTGADTLIGGDGADRFVLHDDGAQDRINDFQNGLDRIDLDAAFAELTITTVTPGTVRIANGSEVLIVADLADALTAADFTAADFL